MVWTFSICLLILYSFVLLLFADRFILCKSFIISLMGPGEKFAMKLVLMQDWKKTVGVLWLLVLERIIESVVFAFTLYGFILMRVF